MGIFGAFSGGGKSTSRKHKSSSGSGTLISSRDGVVEKKAMEGAERELYQFEQPKQELGMTDLIKRHEEGTRFMYAAITGREPEDIASKMRRLSSFQPILKKKAVPIDNLPTVKLFKETETFPLDQVIPKGKARAHGEYIRISDALVMYGAIVSPDCHFTKVKVGISDTGASRCSRPEQQVGRAAAGKAFRTRRTCTILPTSPCVPWVQKLGPRGNPTNVSNTTALVTAIHSGPKLS
jgi:hypothetical protein